MFGTHKNEKTPIFINMGNYIEHEKKCQSKKQLQSRCILFDYINEQLLLLFYSLHLADSFGILVVLAMDLILSFSRWLSSYFNNIYCKIHLFLSDLRGHLCYKLNFHTDSGLGNQTNERELSYQGQSVSSVAQSCLFVAPWTAARQASLSITNSRSLLRLMAIELVMPSNYLILCCPLLLLPSVFPSNRACPKKSVFHIR